MIGRLFIQLRIFSLTGSMLILLSGCWNPPDANERLQRADSYLAEGDYGAAIIELKNLLQDQPDNATARLKLGKLYTEVGRGVTAEKELRKAMMLGIPRERLKIYLGKAYGLQSRYDRIINEIDVDPAEDSETRIEIHVIRGRAFLAVGKLEEARQSFNTALEISPDYQPALTALARTSILQGDTEKAKKIIQRAVTLDPRDPVAWEVNGKLAQNRGEYKKAEESYKRALNLINVKARVHQAYRIRLGLTVTYMSQRKDKEALEQVKVLKKLARKNPLPRYLEALLLYRSRNYAESTEKSLMLLKDSPDHKAVLALLGVTNYRQGSLEQANMYLSKLMVEDPANQAALRLLAMTRAQLSRHKNVEDGLASILKDYGETDQILRTVGVLATRVGDYKAGIGYLEKALAQNPDNTGLQYELISAYIGGGETDKAVERLQSMPPVYEDSESYFRHTLLLVMAYMGRNENELALQAVQALAKIRPDDAVTANLLGSVYLESGKIELARKQFEEVVRRHPDNRTALLKLAALSYRAGKLDAARARYAEILRSHPEEIQAMVVIALIDTRQRKLNEAGRWLEKAVKLQPDSLDLKMFLARNYLSRKKSEAALRLIQDVVRIAPDRENAVNMLGIIQMENGDHFAAIQTFKSAIEKFPPSATRYYNLARVQLVAGVDEKAAIATLRKALETEQEHIPSLVALTRLYLRTGHNKAAFELTHNLQERDPKNAMGFILEGYVRMKNGEYKQAVQAYEQAIARDRTRMAVWRLSAARAAAGFVAPYRPLIEWLDEHGNDAATRLLLARVYNSAGEKEMALKQYRQTILERPDYVPALNNAAWICLQLEKACALEYSRKAYEYAPDNAAVIDTLAWSELKLARESALAVSLLRKAVTLEPEDYEISYHLAVALAEDGEGKEALSILERITAASKPFNSLEEARVLRYKLGKK